MWSRVRFVKMPAANRTPFTRPWSSAWDETSIAADLQWADLISAKNR
jgi:hypothetical protein